MRVAGLISGGKDSCYNMMQAVAAGHTIVALANLQPIESDEMDSYMFQTVGHHAINLYANAMGLPLYRQPTAGKSIDRSRDYQPTEDDEVEDLYNLLARLKDDMNIEAVAVGAILSDYQRIRVENVCGRLGLVSLAYLWRRNQKELLKEIISGEVEAIIIKVAALGLDPKVHLGMTLRDIQPHLMVLAEKYGINVCGEGGEYETFTLDCPLFRQKLVIDEKEMVIHSDDPVAPVGYLNLTKVHLELKEGYEPRLLPRCVRPSLDYVGDLNNTIFSDLSDVELSESELDSMDQLEKDELKKERKKQSELNPLLTYAGDNVQGPDPDEGLDSTEEGFTYEHSESERDEVVDHQCIFGNRHGWFFIGGIVGEGDTEEATDVALKKLINLLQSQNLQLKDVCSVNIYMRDMEEYALLNKVYIRYFYFDNPPTRVCVQCPLPKGVGLILDAVAHKFKPTSQIETDNGVVKERRTLHVQSVSHWAPANIGPYSQAVKVGEVIGTSGQIALVPGSMALVAGGAAPQCALALRHLTRVLRAVHPRAHIRSVVQSVCYLVGAGGAGAGEARRQLEARTAGAIAQYAVVCALPRAAQLEWHAWAHTDNNRFEYEETGCSIGDYKVAITRRWNYENTVAAIVCYVATGSSPSTSQLTFPSIASCANHRELAQAMTQEQLEEVLEYAIKKLLNDCQEKEACTALKIRIFYQVWCAPGGRAASRRLARAAAAVRARVAGAAGAALSAVPVRALHAAFTFLSISGLRLDE